MTSRREKDQERELEDALESLRHAKLVHNRVATELQRDTVGTVQAATGPPHAAKAAVLKSELGYIQSQLQRSSEVLQEDDAKLKKHVRGLKSDVHLMSDEVDRMSSAVGAVQNACDVSQEEVGKLKGMLAQTVEQRDALVSAFSDLMTRTKRDMETLRGEMMRQDTEIARLREQNSFLRARCAAAGVP